MSPKLSSRLLLMQPDERLAQLVREGHDRAFEAVVLRYRRALTRYCARLGLHEMRAEDVLQQSLVQAWIALRRGDDVRDLRAWLYRIVHNTAVNALRAGWEQSTGLEGEATAAVVSLEDWVVTRETLGHLAALPPLQRDAILLSAIEGRSYEEVAAALGITQGAVRGLLHRARTALRSAAAAVVPAPLVAMAAGLARQGTPTAVQLSQLGASGGTAASGGMFVRGAAVVAAAALLGGIGEEVAHGHHHHAAAVHRRDARAAGLARGVAGSADAAAAAAASATRPGSARHTVAVGSTQPAAAAPSTGGSNTPSTSRAPAEEWTPRPEGAGGGSAVPAPSRSVPAGSTAPSTSSTTGSAAPPTAQAAGGESAGATSSGPSPSSPPGGEPTPPKDGSSGSGAGSGEPPPPSTGHEDDGSEERSDDPPGSDDGSSKEATASEGATGGTQRDS